MPTMKTAWKIAVLLCAGVALRAGAQPSVAAPAPAAAAAIGASGAPAAPALTQARIRDAVRAVLAEEAQVHDALAPPAMQQVTIRADKYERFAAAFAEAKVPDCLRPDGLSRQPTNIGPIGVVGVYALPFVAIARLRGKCN